MSQRPTIAGMVKEAVQALGGEATNAQIKDRIRQKHGNVNPNSISGHIVLSTVNTPGRINFPPNQTVRVANVPRYDFLYKVDRGQVVLYDPQVHGTWEIRKDEFGKLRVVRADVEPPEQETTDDGPHELDEPTALPVVTEAGYMFPLESHLRDFIARNIENIKVQDRKLQLYVDDMGNDGVEYRTGVGPIDILALDEAGNFVIFELKLSKGPDYAIGQIARYMGWVRANLAQDKGVSGVIVCSLANEKLKYAASIIPEITLLEYELRFDVQEVKL